MKFPHAEQYREKFVFHAGEPEQDPELRDEKPGEARQADAHWENENRTSWQLHSKWGPNPDAEGIAKKRAAIPFEELVNPTEPQIPYNTYWEEHTKYRNMNVWWPKLQTETAHYSDETLARDIKGMITSSFS